MKRNYTPVLFLSLLSMSAYSAQIENELSSLDIDKSITRCCETFSGNYSPQPIFDNEMKDNIGRIDYTQNENNLFLTFRGSTGLNETISNVNLNPKKLFDDFGISGFGHENILKSYTTIKQPIFDYICSNKYINEEYGLSNLNVWIEGSSRGGALSAYTALGLIHNLKLTPNQMKIMTYGSVDVLDEEAANYYNQLFRGRHLSFKAQEDKIPQLANLNNKFHTLGIPVEFSAKISSSYRDRVNRKEFTHMIPSAKFLANFIPNLIESWEAHMPETYQELSSKAFINKFNHGA